MSVLALLLALQAPPEGWTEVRFHRVTLKNGNFVDGALVSNEPEAVTLRVKTGHMEINRDLVLKVEYLKIRSYAEKAENVPPPLPELIHEEALPPVPVPPPAPAGPVRTRIEDILAKARLAPADRKDVLLGELILHGYEGGLVLVSLLEKLGDSELRLAGRALREIRVPGLREPVKALLRSPNPLARAEAVEILAVHGVETDRLADAHPRVRAAALRAVEIFKSRSSFERSAVLCGDANPEVRRQAVRSSFLLAAEHELGGLLVDALRELLRGSSVEDAARVEILDALGRLRHASSWPSVADELRRDAADVRVAAARCLGELRNAEASTALADAMTEESSVAVRVALAEAAGKLKDLNLVPALIERLADPDPKVIRAAGDALSRLTGQNHGVDAARWTAYWAQVSR